MFSPVNAEFEQRAADIVTSALPGVHVSLSHEIGRIGLLERENATIVKPACATSRTRSWTPSVRPC